MSAKLRCTEAILAAGVRRVVAAMRDPFPKVAGGGLALGFVEAGLELEVGVESEDAAQRLNAPTSSGWPPAGPMSPPSGR